MADSKDRYIDECPYSKTGWAWWAATGGCTCIPAKEPKMIAVYLGFAAEVSELFAKGSAAGLSHEQLINILRGQLDFEQRLKNTDDANQRTYA